MNIEMEGSNGGSALERPDPKEFILGKIDRDIQHLKSEVERLEKIKVIIENNPFAIELLQLVGL